MKNATLYIDLAFCFILLPLVIYAFPVERWWGTYPLFFCSSVGWLYVTYFLYKYFIIPRLFLKSKKRVVALLTVLLSLSVTFFFNLRNNITTFLRPSATTRDFSVSQLGNQTKSTDDMVTLHSGCHFLFCCRNAKRSIQTKAGASRNGI